jgi:hypothetical protein
VHETKKKYNKRYGEVVCAWSTSGDILFNFFYRYFDLKRLRKNVDFMKCTKYTQEVCTREKYEGTASSYILTLFFCFIKLKFFAILLQTHKKLFYFILLKKIRDPTFGRIRSHQRNNLK